jgi:murein DD-endopeptidase MepM/ murein hydrolase activator NlpD
MNKVLSFVALITLIASPTPLHAQEDILLSGPYANAPEVVELKDQIEDKQSKIEEAKRQSTSLQTQLLLLDNQITKIELDIKTAQITYEKTQLEIDAIESVVEKEEVEITAQKERLKEYIMLINKNGKKSTLEVLLLNDSFADFFNEINYLEQIQADLKTSIDRVRILKENLETQKQSLVNYSESLKIASSTLEDKQERLKEQLTAKEGILYDTKRSEVKYVQLLSEAKDVQKEVDLSITEIKDEIKNTDPKSTFLFWPVKSGGITTYFNDPDYPYRYLFEHAAVDIRAPQGSDIIAPADGYVARARNNGYGYSYITLIHDNGLSTVYGHVNKILVKTDQFVKAGDVIGKSGGKPGSLGAGNFTTGAHLHFETRLNGIPVDPLQYLP